MTLPFDQAVDKDGLLIPPLYAARPDKWEKMPLGFRKTREASYIETLLAAEAKEKIPPKTPKPYAPRFSTDYAVKWGRKQGWTLIDRENYNHKTKRHHDLQLGLDALFDTPDGMVGIQGAGRSEKADHLRRFTDRGGIEKARRRHIRVVYLEFVRGNRTPVLEEWWA